jgi:hypothetical protein
VGGHEECVGSRAYGYIDCGGDVASGVFGGFADICVAGLVVHKAGRRRRRKIPMRTRVGSGDSVNCLMESKFQTLLSGLPSVEWKRWCTRHVADRWMVDWSFGVDRNRPEAWDLVGRDDVTAALAANVLTLFSDMMRGYVYVKKDGSVQSCIIAASVGLVLRKPRFNIIIFVTPGTKSQESFRARVIVSRTLK